MFSVPHTVWPFVKWALVWLCFMPHNKSLSLFLSHTHTHTSTDTCIYTHIHILICLCKNLFDLKRGPSSKITLRFLFLFLMNFPHYPLFQTKTLSLLSQTGQKNSLPSPRSSNPWASRIYILRYIWPLLTPSLGYKLPFTDSGRQEKFHVFIFYKSNYFDFQVLLAWWFSGASCHGWDMRLYLKPSQYSTAQT